MIRTMYRRLMYLRTLRSVTSGFALAVALAWQPALAQTADPVDKLVAGAQEALDQQRYKEGVEAYRKAAEISNDVEVAQQAARIAYSYGFNKDALAAAKRWVALDDESDEALLYVAQLQLREGDIRQSQKNFEKLLKRGDEPADERLISLIPLLSQEDAELADELMRRLSKPYKDSAYAHYAAAVMALQAADAVEAGKRAERAIALDPEWIQPKLVYGRSLLLAGDEDAAIEYTSRIIGDDPDP
ncbi:MAG TPA: hypothetical protein VGA68_02940, partial [Woeseiaceae bacterium]